MPRRALRARYWSHVCRGRYVTHLEVRVEVRTKINVLAWPKRNGFFRTAPDQMIKTVVFSRTWRCRACGAFLAQLPTSHRDVAPPLVH